MSTGENTQATPANLEADTQSAPGPAPARPARPATPVGTSGRPHRARPYVVSFTAYLAIAVAFWWGAWSTHPTTTATCGCGDASLFLWFLEWPAYALAHGHNLLYSTALFHPGGFNLLSNTGVLAIGVAVTPITWLFGSVASLNVVSTLIPVLSAMSMFWLLRRWVRWAPAAFIGGLLFGFSPLVLSGLSSGWLTMYIAVPPLIVACLDELFIRQRRRPVAAGVVLGGLVVVQFFISTEVLAITAVTVSIGVVVIAAYAALRSPQDLRRRARHAGPGAAMALLVAVPLLAYPVWFALAGPAHLSGRVWPGVPPGYFGTRFSSFLQLDSTAEATVQMQRFGAYQGTAFHQAEYVGLGLLAVVIIGTVIWHRDRRLWLFGSVGAISVTLCLTSLTQVNHFWVPWRVLGHVPVIQNILPIRFVAMTFLCAGVMVALIVDHVHGSVLQLGERASGRSSEPPATSRPRRWSRRKLLLARSGAAVAGLAVSLIALVPIASTYAGNLPLTMQPVVLPQWFASVAPHLAPGQVILTYPPVFGGIEAPMAWQAVDRLSFSLVGGGGPGSVPERAGAERPGFTVLAGATLGLDPTSSFSPSAITSVRNALIGWGTTLVVIPDQPSLPRYDQGNHTAYAVGLITLALGVGPQYRAQAWTWAVGRVVSPSVPIEPEAFRLCVGTGNYQPGPPQTVPDCVLGRHK